MLNQHQSSEPMKHNYLFFNLFNILCSSLFLQFSDDMMSLLTWKPTFDGKSKNILSLYFCINLEFPTFFPTWYVLPLLDIEFYSTWHHSLSIIHEEKLIPAPPSKHSIHSFLSENFPRFHFFIKQSLKQTSIICRWA